MHFNLMIMLLVALNVAAPTEVRADDNKIDNNSASALNYKVTAEDMKWAIDLTNNSMDAVWRNLKAKFNEQEQLAINAGIQSNIDEDNKRQFAGLYIFVSTSMPQPLLKSYLREANKYGGVLVFKGIPGGSFKELASLITELFATNGSEQKQTPSIQIDDEAFDRFNITSVPCIVLAEEEEYVPNQASHINYDKISGNVGIKYALERFEHSGQLPKQATEVLNEAK